MSPALEELKTYEIALALNEDASRVAVDIRASLSFNEDALIERLAFVLDTQATLLKKAALKLREKMQEEELRKQAMWANLEAKFHGGEHG